MKNFDDEPHRGPKQPHAPGTAARYDREQAAASAEKRVDRIQHSLRAHNAGKSKTYHPCKGCGAPVSVHSGYEFCEACRTQGVLWTCQGCGKQERLKPRQVRRKWCGGCAPKHTGARRLADEVRDEREWDEFPATEEPEHGRSGTGRVTASYLWSFRRARNVSVASR